MSIYYSFYWHNHSQLPIVHCKSFCSCVKTVHIERVSHSVCTVIVKCRHAPCVLPLITAVFYVSCTMLVFKKLCQVKKRKFARKKGLMLLNSIDILLLNLIVHHLYLALEKTVRINLNVKKKKKKRKRKVDNSYSFYSSL